MVIFASSVGRSGTRYLANLFTQCTNVLAQHAAVPHCHDQIMIDINNNIPRTEVVEKARLIEELVAEHGAYFESTQLFVRVLADVFLDVFPAISVIHLLRDPMEVASSYMNRKSYPSHADRPWRLPLNLERSLFKFPLPLTPIQENLCDWLENELRYWELRPRFERTVDFQFEKIGCATHVCEMFDQLDVAYRESDVNYHTSSKDLDRNANRRKTRISRKIERQSTELVDRLRDSDFPRDLFQQDCYRSFDFIHRLTAPG